MMLKMSNNEVNFNIGDDTAPMWASPQEFLDAEKKISIVSFAHLSKEKGETTAKFVDHEGMTYRLTFNDLENDGKERHLEVHAKGFKVDLANSVKREFGSDSLPVGSVVYLKNEKIKKRTSRGVREIYKWTLRKSSDETEIQMSPTAPSMEETKEKFMAGDYDEHQDLPEDL